LLGPLKTFVTQQGEIMRKQHWWAVVGIGAMVAAAQPAKQIFTSIGIEIQGPLKQLTVLEEEEKKLRTSEQAQIYASDEARKQRARVERDIAQLKMEAAEADAMRQRAIDSGCPAEGGRAPIEVANRCNPLVDAHTAVVARLLQRMESLKVQENQVNQLRDSISATVFANAQKRKQIETDRARLTAERDRLQALAIAELIKRNKLGAAKACTSQCCRSVIFDGADPKRCGLSLVCQSFENAGLFSSTNRICSVGAISVPAVQRTDGAAAKRPWEIEFERKEAIYKQELAKQQQAVAQYERDKAAMERTRAEQRARAAKAEADWRAAVAACRAGDYSKCARAGN